MGNSTRRGGLLLTGCLSLVIGVSGIVPASFVPVLGAGEARADSESLIRISQTGPDAHRRLKLGLNKAVVVDLPEDAHDMLVSDPTMGGFTLPAKTVREIISTSVDVVIQAARLRDGSRRITQITEVIGMEGDVIITQDLMRYEIEGEDAGGRLIGRHMSTGVGKPHFWDRARYFNEEKRLAAALDAMEAKSKD